MRTLESIAKTTIQLLLAEPFYGHFFMGLQREVSITTPTAAVALSPNNTVKVLVNADFWEPLSKDHRYGLIKHEVLHLALQHLFVLKNYANRALFNVAADLVVNQYIERRQLPEGGLLLEQFRYLEHQHGIVLETGKDVGYYYRLLDQSLKQPPRMSFEQAARRTGNPSGQTELIPVMEAHPSDHQFWEKFGSMTEPERQLAQQQMNRVLKQTAERLRAKSTNFGNLPGALAEQLRAILEAMQPQVNWRRVLRLFATSSNSTYLKNTIRRASKRYGTVPGIRMKRRNKLLVAIDTSGSVQQNELAEFFNELYFIWRQGAQIRVVECDTRIAHTYDYRGHLPTQVHGRGGTSFEAPIQYGNDTYQPDALIYFTDGYAPAPKTPPRYPMLWVISSNGLTEAHDTFDQLPGRKLKLE